MLAQGGALEQLLEVRPLHNDRALPGLGTPFRLVLKLQEMDKQGAKAAKHLTFVP